jgi:hypothetical protein
MDPFTLAVIGVVLSVAGILVAIKIGIDANRNAKRFEIQQQIIAESQEILDRHRAIAPEIRKRLNELDDLLAAVMRADRPYLDETLKEQASKNITALRPYEECRRLVEAEVDYFNTAIDYFFYVSGVDVSRADADPFPGEPPPRESSRAKTARRRVNKEIQNVRDEINAWGV